MEYYTIYILYILSFSPSILPIPLLYQFLFFTFFVLFFFFNSSSSFNLNQYYLCNQCNLSIYLFVYQFLLFFISFIILLLCSSHFLYFSSVFFFINNSLIFCKGKCYLNLPEKSP